MKTAIVIFLLGQAFTGTPGTGDMPRNPIFLPADTIVESVECDDFEAWIDRKGDRIWRATAGARIETYEHNMRLRGGDVTQGSAPDLWQQLEWQCAPEYGAGIWDAS